MTRGDADRAFEWFERAYPQHDAGLTSVKVDQLLRCRHDDPRWRRMLERMGFAERLCRHAGGKPGRDA
jgi:hypothetical protein